MAVTFHMDYRKLVERFGRAASRLEGEVDRGLDAVAQAVVDDLKATGSFDDRTGSLRRGFTYTSPSRFRRVVCVDDSRATRGLRTKPSTYGAYLEGGTARIAPRRFFEHVRGVLKRRLKREMVAAFKRAMR